MDSSISPDRWVGEDIYVPNDTLHGFRNMANPAGDNDPDPYDDRLTDGFDSGGIHSNSVIPNHAYYLLVNGGKNAGCCDSTHRTSGINHTHTAGCNVADGEKVFFLGFIALSSGATMDDAHAATKAAATTLDKRRVRFIGGRRVHHRCLVCRWCRSSLRWDVHPSTEL